MHIFTIPIGDWSDDGHGKCEKYIIECSHSASDCRRAYIDSCRLTGLQFHHNSPGIDGIKGIPLVAEYEEGTIPWNVVEKFREHGFDLIEDLEDIWEEGEDIGISPSEMGSIIMGFIGMSIGGEFTWSHVKEPEALFGYWNDELNVQMGYGLFY